MPEYVNTGSSPIQFRMKTKYIATLKNTTKTFLNCNTGNSFVYDDRKEQCQNRVKVIKVRSRQGQR